MTWRVVPALASALLLAMGPRADAEGVDTLTELPTGASAPLC